MPFSYVIKAYKHLTGFTESEQDWEKELRVWEVEWGSRWDGRSGKASPWAQPVPRLGPRNRILNQAEQISILFRTLRLIYFSQQVINIRALKHQITAQAGKIISAFLWYSKSLKQQTNYDPVKFRQEKLLKA